MSKLRHFSWPTITKWCGPACGRCWRANLIVSLRRAVTGRQAVTLALQHKPDIVVMDITMPELNGLEAARQILKAVPACRC